MKALALSCEFLLVALHFAFLACLSALQSVVGLSAERVSSQTPPRKPLTEPMVPLQIGDAKFQQQLSFSLVRSTVSPPVESRSG